MIKPNLNRFIYVIISFFIAQNLCAQEKHIVVVIPSYNNKKLYERNLRSVIEQEYSNYTIVYVDDCSPDGTGQLVEEFIEQHNVQDRFILVKNQIRCLATRNIYYAIHNYCADDDIVVLLDGDDWLAQKRALAIINQAYQDPDVWLTYGFYRTSHGPGWGFTIPQDVIQNNSYRTARFNEFKCAYTISHPRTFYAWLYKLIKMEDLQYQGEFMRATYDQAKMYPMLEMSAGRFKMLQDVLYVYYIDGELHDFKINREAQLFLDDFIHKMQPYEPLPKPIKKASLLMEPFSCCLLLFTSFEKFELVTELAKKLPHLKNISRIIACKSDYIPDRMQIGSMSVEFAALSEDINSSCKCIVNKCISEDYCLIATDELFGTNSLDLAMSVKLLRQTEGLVLSSVKYVDGEKHELKHTTFLQDDIFVFQLQLKPILFYPYKEYAHLFLTKNIQERYIKEFELFDDSLQMQPHSDLSLAKRSGLMRINM